VSEFFEPPPAPEPEPEQKPRPPWMGPPEGTLAGVVALELVLARSEKAAVCVTRLSAYPTGFGLELMTIAAEEELDPCLFGGPRMRGLRPIRASSGEIPPEMLRFGIQFADGSKATNTERPFPPSSRDDPEPERPLIFPGGGGGGGGSWRQEMWVWPLPPPGPIAFVCEWPVAGIPLTRHEIDAQLILDAAQRAQVVFPEDDMPSFRDGRSGARAFISTHSRPVATRRDPPTRE